MTTEKEQLEKGVLESKARQTVQAVNDYMDVLIGNMESAEKKYRFANIIYLILWGFWVASSFLPDEIYHLGMFVFVMGLIYDQWCFAGMGRARAEFRGAMRILEILGYISPRPPEGEPKKRKLFSEFTEMVKGWAAKKQKAQEEVYAPA